MALTDVQTTFIQNYIADLGRFRASRAKSQYKDFARRYNDTEVALNVLPQGHPTRTLLGQQLAAAKTLAENGEFKDAYKDLKDVKAAAKLAANGYVDTITSGTLKADIDNLETLVNQHKDAVDQALRRVGAFQTALDRYTTAADKASLSEATLFLKGFANYEGVFDADFYGRLDLFQQRCTASGNAGVTDRITRLKRKFDLAEKDGRMGEISEQVARVIMLERTLEGEGGIYIKPAAAKSRAEALETAYKDRIRAIKSLDSFKSDEDWASIKLDELLTMFNRKDKEFNLLFATEDKDVYELDSTTLTHAMETDDAGLKQSVFIRLQKEEEARVERARAEYLRAVNRDKALTDGSSTDPTYAPAVAEELDSFDSAYALGNVFEDLPDSVDNMVIMQKIGDMNLALKGHLADLDDAPEFGVDEALLDLMLMDEKEMFASLARAAGCPETPDACTDDHRALLKEMSKAAVETIRENAPNKMAPDMSSITVGGKVFALDKKLGGGANGTASRFKDPVTGESLIVKSLKGGMDPAAMKSEMRTHARLQKGDTTESKDHIAEFKGAAYAEDGTLHMIMADAGGADLKKTTNTMMLMDEVGAMPPEARTALTRDLVRQTIEGLKYLEEKNAIHNDLKPENIIIDDAGLVKIIDFGESRFADAEGKEAGASVDTYGTTKVYEAPEQWETKQAEVTKGVDTFAIGGILKALGGGYGEIALGEDFRPAFENNSTPFRPEDHIATGLDRAAGATMDADPANRPSLDAIAASSFLSTDEDVRDYVPEDVADLKTASMEYQKVVGDLKVTLAANQIQGMSAGDKGLVDIQGSISKSEGFLVNTRAFIKRKEAGGETVADSHYAEVGKLEGNIKQLKALRNDAISEARAKGEKEYNALLNDEALKITLGAKEMSIKAALALQEKERSETAKLRGAFYRKEHKFQTEKRSLQDKLITATEPDKPELELALSTLEDAFEKEIASVNAMMKTHQDTINEINALITSRLEDSLTDACKFHLADMKLREVGARFGRSTDASQSTSKASDPPPKEKDDTELERAD